MRTRRELKFVVHHSVRRMLVERWGRYLARAPFTNRYAVSPVLSQYYDSPDLMYYREKLDGLELRNKVRLRTYAQRFEPGGTAFLEIKWRSSEFVLKRRCRIQNFTPEQLDPERWTFEGDEEMEGAFRHLLFRHNLCKSAQVYYQREAYEGAADSDVRITFDSNLLALHPGERLDAAFMRNPARRLMADTVAILEVKATGSVPGWVHEGIVAAELQQMTIPKYVSAVEHLGLAELRMAGDLT